MTGARTGWPLLLGGALLLAGLQLWLRPLLPVDETRYLGVAWEMWWRGEFLVPQLNGEAYSHKPPLLFWLIHALWWLFGVSETAARLVPVLLSLAALYLAALLTRRLWPTRPAAAALAPWLLFGGLFWINFYSLVQFDLLLVLCAMLAWLGVLEAVRRPGRGWLLAGLGIGLGVLAKGPVILVPVLPAMLFAPWWHGARGAVAWPAWYAGALGALLLGAGIALCWAVPAGLAGGEAYRQAIFWGQSAGRMVDSFAHRAAWWSYLVWLPLMWLPWIIWPRLWRAALADPLPGAGGRFCVAVLLPSLLVFSLISGKQGKYLLPLLPLLAALCAHWLAALDRDGREWRPTFAALPLAVGGVLLLLLPWLVRKPGWAVAPDPAWGWLLLAGAAAVAWFRGTRAATLRAAVAASLLGSATLHAALHAPFDTAFDLRPLSGELAAVQERGRPLAWLGKYHGQFQFLGRLRAPVTALASRPALLEWLRGHPDGYLLVNYKTRDPDLPEGLQARPYRGGSLVLWPAQRLLHDGARLDALPGSA